MRGTILLLILLWCAAAARAGAPVFEDTIAQRTLACTACHGRQGRAGPDGYYPRIAGKPAGYLYNQLLNFRDGRRHYGLMVGLLDTLSDSYLYEIAQHFATLDVPYPPPQPASAAPDLLQRGREIALQGDAERRVPACARCHGKALTGVQPNLPGLLGLPRDYLNAQLGAWRTGQRRALAPDCMAEIARRLSPEDLSAVTTFLAAEPLPKDPHPAAAPEPAKAPVKKGRRAPPPPPPEPPPLRCGSAEPPAAGASR
ncbi:c-type cytochrome [Ramlibacter monticola]|uniref:c-type cytochrome n=1 Tax=Ramlibacter monticola TaxID=1926872 RepID=UPI001F354A7C|nr:cytochrome C [Ramlibacter monticola]